MTTPSGGEATAAGVGLRLLALIGALVLAFGTAVLVIVTLDVADAPTCAESIANQVADECYLGSSFEKLLATVLTGGGAIFGAIATLLALGFALGASTGRKLVISTIVAVVLAGVAIIFF